MGLIFGVFFGAGSGALIGIGIPENILKRYQRFVGNGGILMSVHTDPQHPCEEVKEILTISGAQDVSAIDENLLDQLDEPNKVLHLSEATLPDQPTQT
jgi:hypothetical protein